MSSNGAAESAMRDTTGDISPLVATLVPALSMWSYQKAERQKKRRRRKKKLVVQAMQRIFAERGGISPAQLGEILKHIMTFKIPRVRLPRSTDPELVRYLSWPERNFQKKLRVQGSFRQDSGWDRGIPRWHLFAIGTG